MQSLAQNRRRQAQGRQSLGDPRRARGFTLIELLVSLSILLILAAITIRLVNGTLDSDRMKGGARELQSYLAGARDRAIYAGQPRGVRFLPDTTDSGTVRSFVYIGAPTNFTDGAFIDIAANGAITFESPSTLLAWQNLWSRALLVSGVQIQLSQGPNVLSSYFTVSPNPNPTNGTPTTFTITTAPTTVFPMSAVTYQLHLAPAILTGEQPRALPQNIVIDLRSSILPSNWPALPAPNTPAPPSRTFDVLFSPQGTVIGAPAASGRIHFLLADLTDTTGETYNNSFSNRFQLNAPWAPATAYSVGNVIVPTPGAMIAFRCTAAGTTGAAATQPAWPNQPNVTVPDSGGISWQSFVKKANLIVSLATATGRVTSHPVDLSTQLAPGYDSFRFAEIGEVTQ